MKRFQYLYLISYSHSRGFGSYLLWLKRKINSVEQLDWLSNKIKKDPGITGVVFLSFQLLRKRRFVSLKIQTGGANKNG